MLGLMFVALKIAANAAGKGINSIEAALERDRNTKEAEKKRIPDATEREANDPEYRALRDSQRLAEGQKAEQLRLELVEEENRNKRYELYGRCYHFAVSIGGAVFAWDYFHYTAPQHSVFTTALILIGAIYWLRSIYKSAAPFGCLAVSALVLWTAVVVVIHTYNN